MEKMLVKMKLKAGSPVWESPVEKFKGWKVLESALLPNSGRSFLL